MTMTMTLVLQRWRLTLGGLAAALALTFVLGFSLRLLAIRFKWEMPKFVFTGEEK